jgi:hypothetical protein
MSTRPPTSIEVVIVTIRNGVVVLPSYEAEDITMNEVIRFVLPLIRSNLFRLVLYFAREKPIGSVQYFFNKYDRIKS